MKEYMTFQPIKSVVQRKVSPWGRFGVAFLLLFAVLFISSCSDDDNDTSDEVWKLKNEQALEEIAHNPEYTELKSLSNAGSIYYKVLKAGEAGGKRPLHTSRAEVYYKGMFAVTDEEKGITKGDVFDSKLFDDGAPFRVAMSLDVADYSLSLNPNGYGVEITGWLDALQYMVVGDKWEIWIPYQLGYGVYDSNSRNGAPIKGNSTLVYEIELMKVIDIDEF